MPFKTNWTLDETVMPKDMNDIGKGLNDLDAKDKDLDSKKYDKTGGRVTGTVNADNVQVNGNNVFHTGRKPTPSDVGAVATAGGTMTGPLKLVNATITPTLDNVNGDTIVKSMPEGIGIMGSSGIGLNGFPRQSLTVLNVKNGDKSIQLAGGLSGSYFGIRSGDNEYSWSQWKELIHTGNFEEHGVVQLSPETKVAEGRDNFNFYNNTTAYIGADGSSVYLRRVDQWRENPAEESGRITINSNGSVSTSKGLILTDKDYMVGEGGYLKDISGQDLFTINKSGRYKGTSCANQPTGSGWWYYDIEVHTSAYKKITARDVFTQTEYTITCNNGVWSGWNMNYSTFRKPSASDVGALPTTGGRLTGQLVVEKDLISNANANVAGAYQYKARNVLRPTDTATIISSTGPDGEIYLRPMGDSANPNDTQVIVDKNGITIPRGSINVQSDGATPLTVKRSATGPNLSISFENATAGSEGIMYLGTANGTQFRIGKSPDLVSQGYKLHSDYDYIVGDGGVLKDISGQDIRAINNSGRYKGNNCINAPSVSGWWYYDIEIHSSSHKKITAKDFYSQTEYTTTCNNGTWSSWNMTYNTFRKPTPAEIGALEQSLKIIPNRSLNKETWLGINVNGGTYLSNAVDGVEKAFIRLGNDGTVDTNKGTIYSTGNKPTPTEIGAVPTTGGELRGSLNMINNGGYKSYDTTGVARDLTRLNVNDEMVIGWNGMPKPPLVYQGTTAYELYHKGAKPTPTEIGCGNFTEVAIRYSNCNALPSVSGVFSFSGGSVNAPTENWFDLIQIFGGGKDYVQIVMAIGGTALYVRSANNGVWTSWSTVY
ncbi:hypothetical protein ACQPU1_01265 [Clostridium paraputrificum]|uniref:pyocin knob domain-containing protein n=1 Tax=Clostridium paraputrificum TaxID=29363 RepID=UPI003D335000